MWPRILALAAVGLTVASCGGSDAAAPTRAEYIVKADAICKVSKAARGKLAVPASMAAAPAYFASAISLERKMLADLRALPSPSADAAALAALYADVDVTIAWADKALAAAKAGDQNGMLADLQGAVPAAADADASKKAAAFGFTVCGHK